MGVDLQCPSLTRQPCQDIAELGLHRLFSYPIPAQHQAYPWGYRQSVLPVFPHFKLIVIIVLFVGFSAP
jgi:hypothetical protein